MKMNMNMNMNMDVSPNLAVAYQHKTVYRSPSLGQFWSMIIAGGIVLTLVLLLWLSFSQDMHVAHSLRLHLDPQQSSAACDGAPLPC
jgi:hypothetical protein